MTPTSGDHESLGWNISSQQLICINTDGTTCSTSEPTVSTTLYSYNGDGLRATAVNQSVTNAFIWSASGDQLLADSAHDYVYGIDQSTPILQIETADYESTPSVDLIVDDTNDNARGVVQLQGDTSADDNTLVNYTDYDAFGNPITEAGGTTNSGGLAGTIGVTYQSLSWGFGASYDDSSFLNYLVNRSYDPLIGQFISVDPDLSGTLQPYSYAQNSPAMFSDPLGLRASPIHRKWHDSVDGQPALEFDTNPLDCAGDITNPVSGRPWYFCTDIDVVAIIGPAASTGYVGIHPDGSIGPRGGAAIDDVGQWAAEGEALVGHCLFGSDCRTATSATSAVGTCSGSGDTVNHKYSTFSVNAGKDLVEASSSSLVCSSNSGENGNNTAISPLGNKILNAVVQNLAGADSPDLSFKDFEKFIKGTIKSLPEEASCGL